MTDKFGNEIKILIDKDINCLKKYNEKIGGIIESFRDGTMLYDAGGGGNYGRPLWNETLKENFWDDSQRNLGDF